jgi:hypothetical protein
MIGFIFRFFFSGGTDEDKEECAGVEGRNLLPDTISGPLVGNASGLNVSGEGQHGQRCSQWGHIL